MQNPQSTEDDDFFWDALDEYPFYDCPQPCQSPHDSSPSTPKSVLSLSPSSSSSKSQLGDANVVSDTLESASTSVPNGPNLEKIETSAITTVEDGRGDEDSSLVGGGNGNDDGLSKSLVFLTELVIKAIGFQFNLLISLIMFPFWGLYYSLMFVVNPFYIVGLGRGYLVGKLRRLWKIVSNSVSPFVSGWIEEHKSVLEYGLRFGWGLLWAVLVGSVLVTMLMWAFVGSGLIVRYYLVEEPFELNEGLNFDYTKSKPVAFVPIIACPTAVGNIENVGVNMGGGDVTRVIQPGYKLQTSVTLTLPESDYNRRLGMFQVRVEFLSENGKSLASLSRPCMLEFRSEPIRLLLTFLKVIPLVAGYVSESQTLSLKLSGFTEAVTPTACLKVTIEQRAEFRAGAGIPEVYNSFLHVESDLPFFKRILWYWRRTIFVWLSMSLFMVELLFALVLYGAVMIARARIRGNEPQRSHLA